jgi:2-amino-4-hydroxy-6-hydroxymethyldihydropteridine diphosphokinase
VREVDVTAAIALGGNEGDRLDALRRAADAIEAAGLLREARWSDAFETPPESVGDGGAFLNAVGVGRAGVEPRALLEGLLRIEAALGRVRVPGVRGGPRPIDLDLVLYGDRVIDERALQLPHPRFAARAFVLVPLAQVAKDLVEPRTGRPVHSLLADLGPVALPRVGSLRK